MPKKMGRICLSVPREAFRRSSYSFRRLVTTRISALSRAHRPALLEAFPAKHRPPLCRTEGNRGFLPALRAVCLRFRAHRRGVTPATTAALGPFRLATFATLGFVLEPLVREKHLFAGGKNEFSTALRTLQHLVVIFHEPLSPLVPCRAGAWADFVPGSLDA